MGGSVLIFGICYGFELLVMVLLDNKIIGVWQDIVMCIVLRVVLKQLVGECGVSIVIGDLLLWLQSVCSKLVCLVLVGRLVDGLFCCMFMISNGSLVIIFSFSVLDFSEIFGFDVLVIFNVLLQVVFSVVQMLLILFLVWKVMILKFLCLDSLCRMFDVGVIG